MVVRMKTDGFVPHLKAWGLKVEESPNWRYAGRGYNFYPRAIIAHHTASNSRSGNFASYNIVRNGRSDLPGPLCQILLGRDGTVRLIAAGYANHAGYGGPRAGIPANQGNTYSIGIEAENNGIGEPWSKAQLNAYYRLCAALLKWIGSNDVSKVIGHKEWTSRKIDPAGINMNTFRSNVRKALDAGPSAKTISLAKVKPGKTNEDVRMLKRRLKKRGFFHGENDSKYFGKGMKKAYKEYQKSLGFKGADADGVPGATSLRRLGFYVLD